ncbi:PBPRA1643 family SWIM/SEC-C metal-binding motif protein [Vibrio rumoiensis]|uniref:Zinc chelation protein SecC n=1 Tax=Vibrio rumoiensis 1S-45 TaxID=1188252 RepID=A0A1E5E4S0_9VIBR|nr:PBPRA1643 family SWIM/SEC-C metal-binding motif protein [Vibrio rumoiensis]OEF27529.1 zinc chelation protein SecC [Vibrio rumoiensis 1S-45]
MSKLFFKGRIDTRQNHVTSGYNVNREVKAGTAESPLNLIVNTAERQAEIEAILLEKQLVADITIDQSQDENIIELETILNKPKTTTFEKTPNRNDPCSCGSGKKYKKCCG